MRVPISLHNHQHLFLSVFFITAILVGVKWYLVWVLTGISLMTNDTEHLLMCSLAIYMSSFKTFLLKSFAHFKIEYSVFFKCHLSF